MSDIAPGWYKDPAEPTTQRYWDGEGWLGAPLPADATPPDSPPPLEVAPPPPAPVLPTESPRRRPHHRPGGRRRRPSGHGSPGVLGRGGPMPPAPPPGWPHRVSVPDPGCGPGAGAPAARVQAGPRRSPVRRPAGRHPRRVRPGGGGQRLVRARVLGPVAAVVQGVRGGRSAPAPPPRTDPSSPY